MSYAMFFIYVIFSLDSLLDAESSCAFRSYGEESFVCVCNQTYCDHLDPISILPGHASLYETNRAGARFKKSNLAFVSSINPDIPVIQVNKDQNYQFIMGFGGAFTDASGINIKSLPSGLQDQIIDDYFSSYGLEYNMGRIPIGSCDFSIRLYSYDDVVNDFALEHFLLAKEDYLYKIPFIQKAADRSNSLLLVATPWSSPAWMKTNNALYGRGELKGKPGGKYYQAWADYFIKFIRSYEKNNITLWGISVQNEPTDGCIANFSFQSMCYTAETQRDFIKLNLGPSLQKAGYGVDKLKVMIMDDIRILLPKWVDIILKDPTAASYVSGIAFHWYLEDILSHKLLDITQQKHPGLFLLSTEACIGSYPWDVHKISLGNWNRAERYAHDILQDLIHYSIGWLDWNLVLDLEGGPNWVKNFVDAPIIVNVSAKEYYKQPMYYALAQFSKLLPRGSYRIGIEIKYNKSDIANALEIAAFETPEDKTVVIILNRKDYIVPIAIHDPSKGFLNNTINAHSIESYIW